MENQHRKIVGYRELTQEDIDLMNRIKAAGRELLSVIDEACQRHYAHRDSVSAATEAAAPHSPEMEALNAEKLRLAAACPVRWISIAKTDVQTGVMAAVRAVAQPTDC